MFVNLTAKHGPVTINLGIAQLWEKFEPDHEDDRDLNTVIYFGPDDAAYVKEDKDKVDQLAGVRSISDVIEEKFEKIEQELAAQ